MTTQKILSILIGIAAFGVLFRQNPVIAFGVLAMCVSLDMWNN